jgi:hypothetical protein
MISFFKRSFEYLSIAALEEKISTPCYIRLHYHVLDPHSSVGLGESSQTPEPPPSPAPTQCIGEKVGGKYTKIVADQAGATRGCSLFGSLLLFYVILTVVPICLAFAKMRIPNLTHVNSRQAADFWGPL